MPAAASASLRPISWVAIDLTLTTSVAPVPRTIVVTIRLASTASRAQCTEAAARGDLLLELRAGRARCASTSSLSAAPAMRSCGQSGSSATPARACHGSSWSLGRGCARRCASASGAAAASGNGSVTAQPADPRGRRSAGRGTPASSRRRLPGCAARTSARCTVRARRAARLSPPPMCIRQEASPAVTTLARVASDRRDLVGEHRGGHVGVLQRERPAEAAAGVGVRQLHQVKVLDVPQQPQRPVADAAAPAASGRSGGR